jgi:hypothetical protein
VNASALLRHAWMDLLSAAGFFLVFLFREHFEPPTLSALLLWPVVFEMMLVFALALAAMGTGIRSTPWRNTWFGLIASLYVGLAWLGGRGSELPLLWLAAIWLLGARLYPPAGQRWLSPEHRRWLFNDGLPYTIAVWVLAFFAYLLLIVLVPGDCKPGADGTPICASPAWIFAAVWTPYFIVEALVRASRVAKLTGPNKT